MSIVIPGQYITPAYKLADSKIQKYYPRKGAILSHIGEGANRIPVIVATVVGKVVYHEVDEGSEVQLFLVSVMPKSNTYHAYEQESKDFRESNSISINLPKENDVVLVKITKINTRQAYCEILTVEGFGNVLQDSGVGANGELAHTSVPYGGGSQAFSSHQTVASSQSTLTSAVTNDLGENFKGIIRSQDVRSTDRDKVKIIESFKPGDIVRAIIISLGDGSNYYLSTAKNDLGVLFAKSENGSGDLMFPVDWQTMVDKTSGVVEKRKCAKPFTE
ncbi:5 exonuclease subunit ski4 [Suhomyces tanzawaensis NRRL Y-17324]|uniref:5 exonuclease subunit ski4 n=1 Tax=Suhomyces tanzawaensis NRRL Y-17324 TaxID=984487 RepID=A0A1E4SLI0_9ASCO|nr:5 exonuclease subunit ski4 [Suhomyces tanzawaensis NRRL Y-17324]ODV80381.1 5 exonuclease subunit ski4 [Suhomyces tanzawaensis NRRL Y-17324]